MKKTLNLLYVILILLVGIITVNAETIAEKKAKAQKFLDSYHFHFKYTNMDENYAMIKKIRGDEWRTPEEWFYDMLVRGDLENKLSLGENSGFDVFCHKKGIAYTKYVYDETTMTGENVEVIPEEDICELYVILEFGNDDAIIETEVTGIFEEVKGNDSYQKEALKIATGIQKDFYVNDMDIVNHIINFKTSTNTFFEGDNVTTEFNDIKRVVEENPNYNIFVGLEEVRRGDYFVGLEEGSTFISRDGIIYGFTVHTYGAGTLFYVPIGTKAEDYAKVVEQRVKDYIGDGNHKIKVEKSNVVWNDGEKDHVLPTVNAEGTVLNVLGLTEEEYYKQYNTSRSKEKAKIEDEEEASYCEEHGCIAVPVYKLTIDDQTLDIGIIEATEDFISNSGITSSKNLKTGIMLRTSASSVPLDAVLDIKELELTDEEKAYLKINGFKEVKAYDLSLYSKILDKYISKFNVDSEILIPVDEKNENLKVVYVSDDLKTIEEYDVEYTTIDKQLYMIFRTKHFSNYIIAEKSESGEPVPPLGDNIVTNIFLATISIIGISAAFIMKKKHN